jgi:hypothetical protein
MLSRDLLPPLSAFARRKFSRSDQICEVYRVLAPGGIAFFGMVNRLEGTLLGPHFRNESWWQPVAQGCGFDGVVTSSELTEWRGGPARYRAYLKKGGV